MDEFETVRLPTHVWVDALRRRAEVAGSFATVYRRGDAERGDVLLRVSGPGGRVSLYGRRFSMTGQRVFAELARMEREGFGDPTLEQVEKAVSRDPDLWVVDVDDAEGRHFLTEPVEAIGST